MYTQCERLVFWRIGVGKCLQGRYWGNCRTFLSLRIVIDRFLRIHTGFESFAQHQYETRTFIVQIRRCGRECTHIPEQHVVRDGHIHEHRLR